jgi:hypothetical protein
MIRKVAPAGTRHALVVRSVTIVMQGILCWGLSSAHGSTGQSQLVGMMTARQRKTETLVVLPNV